MNQIAKFSLKNRALIALITIISAIFGGLALTGLKQELAPSISFPQVMVITSYPGSAPEVVNSDVSIPIETAIKGIAGLEGTSASSSSGSSLVTATFDYSMDLATAEQKVQQAVNRIKNQLPEGLDPLVLTGSLDDLPIIQIAISAEDQEKLVTQIEQNVIPELEKLDGVREAALTGAVGERVTITPNKDKLKKAGLTEQALTQSLSVAGILLPSGTVTSGQNTVYVQIGSKYTVLNHLKNLPVIGTIPVKTLEDYASIKFDKDPVESISRVNGVEAVTVSITKTPDGNTVAVSNLVKDLIPELKAAVGDDLEFNVVFDQAPFIEQSIETLAVEGMLGLVFAVIIILIFLFSIRSTLVTAISIPVSLLITLIGMQAANYTLNILTLGALTIAIGRVVDDSIVVIENIKRHFVEGSDRFKTIVKATGEVAGAITASTVTTVAVFLPIALVGGISGELFRPFAMTVTIALLVSLLVALTIVPVLAYWFLKPSKETEHTERADGGETWLQRLYLPVLKLTLKIPALTMLIAVLILAGTAALIPSMKTNFLGDTGQNTFTVSQSIENGLSLNSQKKKAEQVEEVLLSVDGIEVVQTSIGQSSGAFSFLGGSSSEISYSITSASGADQEKIQEEVRTELAKVLDIDTISVSAMSGFGASSAVTVNLSGPSQKSLVEGSELLVAEIAKLDSVVEVSSNLEASQPLIEVKVKRKEAAKYGISELQLGQLVSAQLQPQKIGALQSDLETIDIYLTAKNPPKTVSELKKLKIATPLGDKRLSDLANIQEVLSASSVSSIDGKRSVSITVVPDPNDLGTTTSEITELLNNITLPAGVNAELGGVSADQSEAFEQLGLAVLIAILIVYVVMVATFRSLRQPLLLLISVPFAATGAIGMLLITQTPLGVASIIGALMLVGIVVTNAIVMIDLVNQYREKGLNPKEAVILGASRRLRPILMTALATIFALLPMASGLTGHGGFISQPLALVVIGGLLSSTILTLFVLPTLYWWVEGAKYRRAERKASRESAQKKEESVETAN